MERLSNLKGIAIRHSSGILWLAITACACHHGQFPSRLRESSREQGLYRHPEFAWKIRVSAQNPSQRGSRFWRSDMYYHPLEFQNGTSCSLEMLLLLLLDWSSYTILHVECHFESSTWFHFFFLIFTQINRLSNSPGSFSTFRWEETNESEIGGKNST